jgi:fructose-1,6-bisphosphatase/inositol monophosphatase family enzyme
MSEAVWLLDPIDGTANYVDGSPMCSISLRSCGAAGRCSGLWLHHCSASVSLAVEGGGAFRNGVRIHVAEREVGRWWRSPISPSVTSTAVPTSSGSL